MKQINYFVVKKERLLESAAPQYFCIQDIGFFFLGGGGVELFNFKTLV